MSFKTDEQLHDWLKTRADSRLTSIADLVRQIVLDRRELETKQREERHHAQ